MNFVLALLLGDLTFLLGTAVYAVSLEDVVCQVVAILMHYLFLARFVWMSLLSLNVPHHFYHAMKFIVSEERESWHYLILYMATGWLSLLLAVGYGLDGLCWMNHGVTVIVSFIVPLSFCILFTTAAFVFVCTILRNFKLHWKDLGEWDLKHKTCNCHVLLAIFFNYWCRVGVWVPCSDRLCPVLGLVPLHHIQHHSSCVPDTGLCVHLSTKPENRCTWSHCHPFY